jgi:hypothetical protein
MRDDLESGAESAELSNEQSPRQESPEEFSGLSLSLSLRAGVMPHIWSQLADDNSSLSAASATKITSFDPPLPAILAPYPSESLQAWPALFHPSIKLPSTGPRRRLHLDRRDRLRGGLLRCTGSDRDP